MTIKNFIRKQFGLPMIYDEALQFVKKHCKGKGLEIGGAAHNEFPIDALNVDYIDHELENTEYAKAQLELAGKIKKVDIIAPGDNLPIEDSSVDFVFSSHVIEHFYNPLSAIREWQRVIKQNGKIVMIIPSKDKTFDSDRDCTTITEFYEKDENFDKNKTYEDKHHSVWLLETFKEFAKEFNLNLIASKNYPNDLRNSFIVVLKVTK